MTVYHLRVHVYDVHNARVRIPNYYYPTIMVATEVRSGAPRWAHIEVKALHLMSFHPCFQEVGQFDMVGHNHAFHHLLLVFHVQTSHIPTKGCYPSGSRDLTPCPDASTRPSKD